jgi:mono/diheme cytochrome c family protein
MLRTSARALFAVTVFFNLPVLAQAQPGKDRPAHAKTLERGRYVTVITGCNDCHTPGYVESAGKTPMEQWLVGGGLGFRGPWGTTYPTNLRLYFQNLSEEQWVRAAKTMKTRPPMPWFGVNAIADDDLRAMYHFVRSLGPSGTPAQPALAPGEKPTTPTVDWPMPPR